MEPNKEQHVEQEPEISLLIDQEGDQPEEQEQHASEEPQRSPVEQAALDNGWMPKEDWIAAGKDPDDWVSAKQFQKNGELFGRINTYKHKMIGLENSVKALVEHNKKLYEAGYKTALKELRDQKKAAMLEGDVETAFEIDDRIDELKEEQQSKVQEFQKSVEAPQVNPTFEAWVDRNQWYANSAEMRGAADGLAKEIVANAQAQGKQVDYEKLLTEVSRKIAKRYPEKFDSGPERVSQTTPSRMTERQGGAKRSAKESVSMSSEERAVMMTFVNSGVMTEEEYIADLKKINKGRN